MSDTDFNARLQRIAAQRPQTATAGTPDRAAPLQPLYAPPPPRKTGWLLFSLIWLACGPLGLTMRIARQLYMDLTPDAVFYVHLLAFVAVSHLLLLCATIAAAFTYRTRPWLFWSAFFTWAGYGVGSALMVLMTTG